MDTGEVSLSPDEWSETEARYECAKHVLLRVQQEHCEAAHEFLIVRAQLRQMLESAYPAQELVSDAKETSCYGSEIDFMSWLS